MGRLEYRTMPVPAFPEHTVLVRAGAVTFGVEYRQLDEAAILAEYGPDSREKFDGKRPAGMPAAVREDGVALHVFDAASGDELLRFDCFRDAPHWHLLNRAGSRNVVVEHDVAADGPLLEWALRTLHSRLGALLREAGAAAVADRLDGERVAHALSSVAQISRYVAAAGRPVRVGREVAGRVEGGESAPGDSIRGAKIGPVAQHLLLENDDVKIWQVDTPAGETFWHHYHDYDYVLFHTTEMLGVVYDGAQDHERIWKARLESGADGIGADLGGWCYEHSVSYIPGTGFLSPGYVNVGKTRFTAALIEIKRPRRPDQEGIGYARSDALVGLPPRAGCALLLENDRVRVYETALDPGRSDALRRHLDTAVYVIDGGRVRVVENGGPAPRSVEEERTAPSGHWLRGGVSRQITNLGAAPYRELSVELK